MAAADAVARAAGTTPPLDRCRLDKWLWQARFCKSRSLAAKLCRAGHVRLNRVAIEKPHQLVKPGDVLTLPLGAVVRVIEVLALGERRGPAVEARRLYADLSPPPPRAPADVAAPAEREPGAGRPTKRDRRRLERMIDCSE